MKNLSQNNKDSCQTKVQEWGFVNDKGWICDGYGRKKEKRVANSFLNIRNIHKTYNAVKALIGVDLSIVQGEVHCIVGENGCGKSTLMKIIAGVIQPDPIDDSSITIQGKTMTAYNPTLAMREGIQVIYQDLSLFPNLSVAENIFTNQRVESRQFFVKHKDMFHQVETTLKEINVDIDPYDNVGDLSIAHQQLVAIARAITNNVKLLIMDEPTASLGKSDIENLLTIIQSLREQGVSIIFIGHKLDEVISIADRISVMRDGVLVSTMENSSGITMEKLSYLMTGKEINYNSAFSGSYIDKESKPVLEIRGLTRQGEYQDIDLKLFKGEILGIIGLVGAGRTELVSTVFGLTKPDSGEMLVNGQLVNFPDVQAAIDAGVALVPENRLTEGLFTTKSIKDNINVTTLDKNKGRYGLLSSHKLETHAQAWVSRLRIKTKNPNNPATSLSGGNQQRIVLAKWMANHPQVLILDGPTIGIDIGAKAEIHRYIQSLALKNDLGILMVTDEISEVLQNSSRIIVMANGKIVLDKERADVDEMMINEALRG